MAIGGVSLAALVVVNVFLPTIGPIVLLDEWSRT